MTERIIFYEIRLIVTAHCNVAFIKMALIFWQYSQSSVAWSNCENCILFCIGVKEHVKWKIPQKKNYFKKPLLAEYVALNNGKDSFKKDRSNTKIKLTFFSEFKSSGLSFCRALLQHVYNTHSNIPVYPVYSILWYLSP